MTRKLLTIVAVVALLPLASLALQHDQAPKPAPKAAAKGPVQTFSGEISDGQCAKNGSHQSVMKKASINTAANCTKGCARSHEYVLFNTASKKIYRLDDQIAPAKFAARNVKITGNLDGDTIHVVKIEAAK
jgi:predicted outer membrane protein